MAIIDEEVVSVAGEDIDGKVTIVELHGNIYLTATQPKGQGKPVTMKAVQRELTGRKLYNVDYKKISQALEDSGEVVKIGELSSEAPLNSKMPSKKKRAKKVAGIIKETVTRRMREKFKITLSDDRMKAYLQVDSFATEDNREKFSYIIEQLNKKKVVYGIDKERIVELIKNDIYSEPVLVAEGKPAIEGHDAELIYEFSPDINVTPEVVQDGNIEYYYLNEAQSVEKEQVLVRRKPFIPGTSGIDVRGKRIQHNKRGIDISLPQGKNTVISEDGTELLAATDGYLFISEKLVNVERERMIIKGDVTKEEIGNVSFTGDVTIMGDVLPETKVSVTGDVELLGVVHKAEIESRKGNVTIREGAYETNINAGGYVKTGPAEHCYINAKKDVLAAGALLDCVVMAEGKIIVDGEEDIVGGEIYAGLSIQCNNLGSPKSPPTKVVIVNSIPLVKEIYSITQNLSLLSKQLHTGIEENLLMDKMKKYVSQKERLEKLKKEQGEKEKVAALVSAKDKVILVKGKIYKGVEIQIENAHTLIEKTMEIRNIENVITLANVDGSIVRRKVLVI